jgi:hypothetical protein
VVMLHTRVVRPRPATWAGDGQARNGGERAPQADPNRSDAPRSFDRPRRPAPPRAELAGAELRSGLVALQVGFRRTAGYARSWSFSKLLQLKSNALVSLIDVAAANRRRRQSCS